MEGGAAVVVRHIGGRDQVAAKPVVVDDLRDSVECPVARRGAEQGGGQGLDDLVEVVLGIVPLPPRPGTEPLGLEKENSIFERDKSTVNKNTVNNGSVAP